jgi:phosphoribosylanthranilate isomerase
MFPVRQPCGIKICGLTSAEQTLAVAEAGADAIGLNFWPRSKRYVSVEQVRGWDLTELSAALVAVTVNATLEELQHIVQHTPVQLLQLHGDETVEDVQRAQRLGLPVIKALQIKDEQSLDQIAQYPCRSLLLDSYNPKLYGGEGHSFPWRLLQMAKERYPSKTFLLAGGLTPENVAEAVAGARPAAVDVASGVESAPGVKDLAKVAAFAKAVRAAVA